MKLTGKLNLSQLLLLLLIILPMLVSAQSVKDSNRFRLIHSDKLFLTTANQENILELFGNVHFFYGTTEFFSNRALIFDTQKIARLMGTVRVKNDTLNVTADSLSYYRIPNKLDLISNVVITEQKDSSKVFNRFTSDSGSYDRTNDVISATGRVTAFSQSEKARAKCSYAFWDRKTGYGYLLGNPQLWSEDNDTLHISSEKMEFFDADHRMVATFEVKAQSRDYNAFSDFLLYYLKEDKAIFQGEPRFTSGYADATAEEFYLYFKDRKLYKAELKDTCLVWFSDAKDKPKSNWVKSAFVTLNLKDDNLRDFHAEGKVTYFYEQKKEGKQDFFSNSAEGDLLDASFQEDGKLKTIRMKSKVKGIYRFENNP
jgi:lipopolysaccharide export system protein LptA